MCGIIGAVGKRDVATLLLAGITRLEYRGYDSAGIAVVDSECHLRRIRTSGKVRELEKLVKKSSLRGHTGIAHTRWATHGKPNELNAHPHIAGDEVALVHNGIIENHEALRAKLIAHDCNITSETDSELIAHLVYLQLKKGHDFLSAVRSLVHDLKGAYAIGIIRRSEPGRLLAIRSGSPLVIGLGDGENFISSDTLALSSLTKRFIYLEEGDIADILKNEVAVYTTNGVKIERPIHVTTSSTNAIDKGDYQHFMLKEIFEQPSAISRTLQGRITTKHVLSQIFGVDAPDVLSHIHRIQMVACGTSYHAGLVGKYWLEEIANIPCQVEIASEFRYRKLIVEPDTLFVTLSQSGETADTLAALRLAKKSGYSSTLAICNVAESSLVRESNMVLLIDAGPEIGVASTKSFTCQLTALFLLAISLGHYNKMSPDIETHLVHLLTSLPSLVEQALIINSAIKTIANDFIDANNALFLGRSSEYPIAMEGALKLKEISYIHAEAFPAGELKHGPLALVHGDIPIVIIAPQNEIIDKLKSNIEEVHTRGGNIIVFADEISTIENKKNIQIIHMPHVDKLLAPIIYAIPMQLLAYHVAIAKGTDIDQPRNLAKSVTVE